MGKTILIVAAHTDDEVIGCGGTIARHVTEGDEVYGIFMADGVSSRHKSDRKELTIRNSAAEEVRKILGIKKNYYLEHPDNRLDSLPLIEVIQSLESLINEIEPNIIYTHHHGDLNIDHSITHRAVMTACRPVPKSTVQEIYAFEILSSTEWATTLVSPFVPNHFVNIDKYVSKKIKALKKYHMEMREAPHSRSIENIKHLMSHRGYTVGVNAAEAFTTIRSIR